MSESHAPKLISVKVADVRTFVERARGEIGFAALKQSLADVGLKVPIEIRDITSLPPRERRRPEGGHYRWELNSGQGRLTAARQLGWKTIPAILVETTAPETVGRFLAENMIRRPQPWAEKGRVVRDLVQAGQTLADVAGSLGITVAHARKYLRVVNKTAPEVADEVAEMGMNAAEVLTTLPPADQLIVMQAIREGQDAHQVIANARQLARAGHAVTPSALRRDLAAVEAELREIRALLLTRQSWAEKLGV
jgi:ParB-like chromosome segregation protein Spo0J